MIGARGMVEGKRVLYAAPKETQTEAFWGLVKGHFGPEIGKGLLYKNETLRLLEMPGFGSIRAKTGFDADTLRSDYCDILILDEYAYMDPDVWDVVGQPMLLDNDGDGVFITSPSRKNHAYRLFLKAQADETGRWAAWHGTTFDNPYISKEALAELVGDMSDDAYRQEILAEFLEGEGQVFRNLSACLYSPADAEIRSHQGHRLVAGMDWGRRDDATVLSIGCADCNKELVLDRFTQIGYPVQRDRIKAHIERWHPSLLAEANSIGGPNIEQLREDGVSVEAFNTTHESKGRIIRRLQLALERGTWKWLDRPIANGEMESYEMKVSIQGNTTYGAPACLHDYIPMARAIMLERAENTGGIPMSWAGAGEDDD